MHRLSAPRSLEQAYCVDTRRSSMSISSAAESTRLMTCWGVTNGEASPSGTVGAVSARALVRPTGGSLSSGGIDMRGIPLSMLPRVRLPPIDVGGETRRRASSGWLLESWERWRLGDRPRNAESGSRLLVDADLPAAEGGPMGGRESIGLVLLGAF